MYDQGLTYLGLLWGHDFVTFLLVLLVTNYPDEIELSSAVVWTRSGPRMDGQDI